MSARAIGRNRPAGHRLVRKRCFAAGSGLAELMVAVALSSGVILVATASILSGRSFFVAQDESHQLHESGRFALESVGRAVRQAGFSNWDRESSALVDLADLSPAISGLDDASLKENTEGMQPPVARAVNGSDVLQVRFFGAGTGAGGDGTMLNCGGFSGPEPVSDLERERHWSIFYVAADKTGEPELRCKYRGKSGWNSEAIARGVETFQVLYGVDLDGDGVAERYLNATAIDALEKEDERSRHSTKAPLPLAQGGYSLWRRVIEVKIAMLVRSQAKMDRTGSLRIFRLFGDGYAQTLSRPDPGTEIDESKLPAAQQSRLRKVFVSTIRLESYGVPDD